MTKRVRSSGLSWLKCLSALLVGARDLVQEVLSAVGDGGREGVTGAVGRDRGRPQGAELPGHVTDGVTGAGLDPRGRPRGR